MRHRTSERGFSAIELLIVTVIILALASVGIPALQKMLVRSKLSGSAREISVHLMNARMEAMRLARPVVVRYDYGGSDLEGFVDENDDLIRQDGEDWVFDTPIPPTGELGVFLMGEDLVEGTQAAPALSIDGLTPVAGGPFAVAVFEPDGSIRDLGAFRLADGKSPRANLFEVRIEPRATARIEVRKYVYDGPNGDDYYPQGGNVWEWY